MADAINRTRSHRANLLDLNSFVQNSPLAQQLCSKSDLLVIHRYLYGSILTAIQYWKARDKKLIVDFDQSIEHITEEMPSFAFWKKGIPFEDLIIEDAELIDPPPNEQFKWGLSMMDGATVPSDRLADEWSRSVNIHKLPDYINTSHYPALQQTHGSEIRVGLSRNASLFSFEKSGLMTAMEKIARTHPKIRFVLFDPEIKNRVCGDASTSGNSSFEQSFEQWADTLPGMDIGLIPIYGDYDLRLGHSDLLEFMISKIPWISSGKELYYYRFAKYGQWTENTPEAWERSILEMAEHLETYQRKAEKSSFLFALSQDASVNIDKVLKIYGTILNS